MQFRGGKLRCQRLGTINPVRQVGNLKAPCARGIWAFPFGHFDMYFAYHKYEEVLPRHLRQDELRALFDRQDDLTAGELAALDELAERRWQERDAWIRRHGRAQMPLRDFWYAGEVYGHIQRDGTALGPSEWVRMTVAEWHKAARRSMASPWGFGLGRWDDGRGRQGLTRLCSDHLELFLPAADLRRAVR